ncbi:MAG TPA: BON domain-containing protein [candidate division Zixibacteria bacterium]|nr:BON domain-containing protein [candidate division Zixibacteria bacterium]
MTIFSCCAAAQTFTVVQNQPQAVTESPNATKAKNSRSNKSKTTIDATGDQMKKSRMAESSASGETPHQSAMGKTAHSETKNNSAGTTARTAKMVGGTTGATKPTRHNKQAPSAGAQTAKAQPAPAPMADPKPAPKPAPPVAMSGPAAPPYHAPAWLPESPDSNTLRTQIESALTQDESLVGSKLDVVVNENEINLAGTVPGSREKLAAERIARSFAGNRTVVNKLNIGAQASQPANTAPRPVPQEFNNNQPAANMPAESFAPQATSRPTGTPAGEAPQKARPTTADDLNPSPRMK